MQGEEKNTWNTLRSGLLIVLRKGVMGHGSQASGWALYLPEIEGGREREAVRTADPSSILVTGEEKDNGEGMLKQTSSEQ